jgi:hypothetical protein
MGAACNRSRVGGGFFASNEDIVLSEHGSRRLLCQKCEDCRNRGRNALYKLGLSLDDGNVQRNRNHGIRLAVFEEVFPPELTLVYEFRQIDVAMADA